MREYAQRAVRGVAGRLRGDLDLDVDLADLLVHRVIMTGEAAGKVSEATRKTLPEIPWPDVTGIRHRLLHDYSRINFDILWATVTEDFPPLIRLLESALDKK